MKVLNYIFLLIFPSLIFGQFTFHDPDETSGRLTNINHNDGMLVVASRGENRILEFDGTEWTKYNTTDYNFGSIIANPKELFIDDQGEYWLIYSKDADVFDGIDVQNLTKDNFGFENEYLLDMEQDNDGRYLFSYSNGYGISILDGNQWTHKGDFTGGLEALNDVFVASFMQYDEINDCIWIYSSGDIVQLKNNTATLFSESDINIGFDLSVDYCRDMTVSPDGTVWFAITDGSSTDGGILTFDGETWEFIDDSNGLPAPAVMGICAHESDIYIADPVNDQISKLSNETWSTFTHENSNWPEFYYSSLYEMITIDSEIYIATNSGIIQYSTSPNKINNQDQNSFQIYPNPTTSIVNLESRINSKIENISIYNSQGKEISTFEIKNENKTNVQLHGNSGIYFIRIQKEGGTFEVGRIIKQ